MAIARITPKLKSIKCELGRNPARIRPNRIRGIRNACPSGPEGCDASGPGESHRGPHFVASDVVPKNEKPRSLAAAEPCSYTAWDSNPEPTD